MLRGRVLRGEDAPALGTVRRSPGELWSQHWHIGHDKHGLSHLSTWMHRTTQPKGRWSQAPFTAGLGKISMSEVVRIDDSQALLMCGFVPGGCRPSVNREISVRVSARRSTKGTSTSSRVHPLEPREFSSKCFGFVQRYSEGRPCPSTPGSDLRLSHTGTRQKLTDHFTVPVPP